MLHVAYLMPALPLAGFLILAFFGRRIGNPGAGWLASATVAGSFVVAVLSLVGLMERSAANRSFTQILWNWISVGDFHVRINLLIDPLSVTMALFVTGVSALIHVYSIGYMHKDPDYPKFFAYLNLFVGSMLVLVLAGNLLFTFIGWEGVGLCSYLLIAFWFERDSAASAGKKAFIVNRIGDAGFLLAMFVTFAATHSLDFQVIFAKAPLLSKGTVTAITLLLFLAATGKSAQIPLFTWLPDAMEGPTPVSALIHAATMVTAGVYLMIRFAPLLHLVPTVGVVIAGIGVATAFLAATIASTQQDIKKVIAYSTVSQIGYMFIGVGVGAYVAAIFLMIAHAFYKSLLFLSAGSVIHGLNDEQDIKKMGNLRKYMPITAFAFMIGWLTIAGVPPLAAFWSKGDVLDHAFANSPALWAAGALTAIITAYYMGREFYLVFYGQDRWKEAHVMEGQPHESGWIMLAPMVVLSVLCLGGSFLNLPFHPTFPFLHRWLAPVIGPYLISDHTVIGLSGEWALAVGDTILALVGITIAWRLWVNTYQRPAMEPDFLQRGWLIDETYDRVFAQGGTALATFMTDVIEERVIDGAVNGVGSGFRSIGGWVRKIQTGYIRNYAAVIVLGVVAILAWMLTRAHL